MRENLLYLLLSASVALGTFSVTASSQWIQTGPTLPRSVGFVATTPTLDESGTLLFVYVDSSHVPGDVLFVSRNSGEDWKSVNLGVGAWLHSLVLSHGQTGNALLAATWDAGVFRSTSDGEQWSAANSGLGSPYVTALAVLDTTVFAVDADRKVWASDNTGTTWSTRTGPLTTDGWVYSFAACGNSLFAGTSYGLLRSTDRGVSWTPVNSGLPQPSLLGGGYLHVVDALGGSGSSIFAGMDEGVFRSTDNGANWTAMAGGVNTLCLFTVGDDIYAGTLGAGVVHSSTNPGSVFGGVNQGLANLEVQWLSSAPDGKGGTYLFAGGSAGLYRASTSTMTWAAIDTCLPRVNIPTHGMALLAKSPAHQSTLFVGTVDNGSWRSTDEGDTWLPFASNVYGGLDRLAVSGDFLFEGSYGAGSEYSYATSGYWREISPLGSFVLLQCALAIPGRNGNGLVYFIGTDKGAFLSTDSCTKWIPANVGLPSTALSVTSLVIFGSRIFAASYGGGVFTSPDTAWTSSPADDVATLGSLMKSSADGAWTPLNNGLQNLNVNSLIVSSTAGAVGSTFVAGTDAGIFLSSDSAASWSAVDDGPTNAGIIALAAHGPQLFAATSAGSIFLSTDQGTHWKQVKEGIDAVTALAVSDRYLFVSSGELWRCPLTGLVSGIGGEYRVFPPGFQLDQNYPNPFNPKTVISGQWTAASEVRLAVYDLLGREVAVLANGKYPAGRYQFTFDGTGVASGVYFVRLTAGAHTAVRKMLLLR
ncbi:MAG: T9SS type A sorting domain-containing protein [Bacteroidota bacterium]